MIRKSGYRFSENLREIMLQKDRAFSKKARFRYSAASFGVSGGDHCTTQFRPWALA